MHELLAHHRCQFCTDVFESDWVREEHTEKVHGRRLVYPGELSFEDLLPRYEPIFGWKALSESVATPFTDPMAVSEWLYPLCLEIARQRDPEKALKNAPHELQDRVNYLILRSHHLRRAVGLARYRRKANSVEAKARMLSLALCDPTKAPSYSLQIYRPLHTKTKSSRRKP